MSSQPPAGSGAASRAAAGTPASAQTARASEARGSTSARTASAPASTASRPADQTWRPSPRAARLLACALCAVIPALALGAWWMTPIAAVPLLMLVAERGEHARRIRTTIDVPVRRCFEGETVTATVHLASDGPTGWIEHEYVPAGEARTARRENNVAEARTGSGTVLVSLDHSGSEIVAELQIPRWGRWSLGVIEIDVYDTAGLRLTSLRAELGEVETFPVPAPDRTILLPGRFPDRFGEHSARLPGEGVEFIAVRPYTFGDRQRRINWSATTRRGSVQVNTFEAERAAEAVMVIDALSDLPQPAAPGDPRPRTTLDTAVRGAAGLAEAYLTAHDRVGVVALGGRVRWLTPGAGAGYLYRIAQTVMDLRKDFSYEAGSLARLPTKVLPSGALAYVFSPLLDATAVEAVRDLADRGHPTIVVDVLGHEPPVPNDGDHLDRLALRVWRLDREAVRFALGELGVPVVTWDGVEPLDLVLAPLLQMPVRGRAR